MKESDKKEFLAQYEQIHDSLMRFCIVKSRGIMDPKDLANDVLLVGLENYHKLKDKKALLSYLFSTANHICLNKMRRKKFSAPYDEQSAYNVADNTHNIEARADISTLYNALDQLPELQREAVVLFEISDLPIKEIMAIQNAGESAVKQRIKRGREKLAELIREKDHRKTAVIGAVLFSSNSFGMSDLNSYFQAVKELPLPLSKTEAVSAVSKFNLAGTAVNSTAGKLGIGIVKKSILGITLVGGVVTGTFLLAGPTDRPIDEKIPEKMELQVSNQLLPEEQNHPEENHEPLISTFSDETDLDNTFLMEDSLPSSPEDEVILPLADSTENPENDELIIVPQPPIKGAVLMDGNNYPATGVTTITLSHLGDYIEVKTWDKDEIEVIEDHTIQGKTEEDEKIIAEHLAYKTEKKGNRLIISSNSCYNTKKISFGKRGFNTISFPDGEKAKYRMMERKYVIMVPKKVNLEIKESYSTVIIPDIDGNLSGSLFDADLTTGELTGELDIKLSYSKATMGSFGKTKLVLIDSDIEFDSAGDMELNARYSDIKANRIGVTELMLFESDLSSGTIKKEVKGDIKYSTIDCDSPLELVKLICFESKLNLKRIDDMNIQARYCILKSDYIGNLEIPVLFESRIFVDKVNVLKAPESKYSRYEIGMLGTSILLSSFQDNHTISNTNGNLSSMDFEGKYTTYKIDLAEPSNYRLDLRNNYGKFDPGDLKLTIDNYEEKNQLKLIKGFIQDGTTNSSLIKFDCFEGNIQLN